MAIFGSMSRRSLLKMFLALPFFKHLGSLFEQLLGYGTYAAVSEMRMFKVARVSQLDSPWSTAAFEYFLRVKGRDVKGETIREEYLPGLVIRLPDELAQKRGGALKNKFEVVNLYCTHQRCKTAFISDPAEIKGMTGKIVSEPVFYCPCHRSLFDAAKGAEPLVGSEAKEPLWKFNFEIKGDDIIITGADPKALSWDPGRAGGLSSEYPVRPGERGL